MSSSRPKIEHMIQPTEAEQPLAELVAVVAALPAEDASALIARGGVWIDRQRAAPDTRLAAGAQLTLHFPPSGAYDAVQIDPAAILWEDRWLLALAKQPGWYANYTPWDIRGTIPYALHAFLADRDGHPPTLHLAHQLDRDTSGVLLVSKDPAINPALQRLFLEGGMHKRYLALAAGHLAADTLVVRTGHGRGQSGLFRVYPADEIGTRLPFGKQRIKAMETRFEAVERRAGATLLWALPATGRTHQIRLHLAYIGHPIAGDLRYGGPAELAGHALTHHLLHAAELAFPHPVTGEPLRLRAPLPPGWLAALDVTGFQVP